MSAAIPGVRCEKSPPIAALMVGLGCCVKYNGSYENRRDRSIARAFERVRDGVAPVLEDPMERLGMARCARNLVDGRGGDRIVNGMEIMLRTPGRAMPVSMAA